MMDKRQRQISKKYLFGFTVIELLAVIAIIGILAAILLPALSKARVMAKKSNASGEIHQLVVAIRMYAEDWGAYPNRGGVNDGTNCGDLVAALEDNVGNGPYCEWPADKKSGGNLLDPWERSYRYDIVSVEGAGIGMGYNIWSDGPNKSDDNGAGDDIKSW